MLSRRHLRIKVLQALYGYFQSEDRDINRAEKELLFSVQKFYDSYILLLLLPVELSEVSRLNVLDAREKYITQKKKEDTSLRFADSPLIKQVIANPEFTAVVKKRKISWQKDIDVVRKLFNILKKTSEYQAYINDPSPSYKTEQDFLTWLIKRHLASSDIFNHTMEEINLYWGDDKDLLISMGAKTFKNLREESSESFSLLPLYKDPEDDESFMRDLLRKTILHEADYSKDIAEKTKNWEVERIALTDIILMKMALTEILHFSSVPVKVSINEYIEISKDYSTPKSKIFINGVIDSLVNDYKAINKIKKTGRGLME
jgi:transcription antitermination protein NusB